MSAALLAIALVPIPVAHADDNDTLGAVFASVVPSLAGCAMHVPTLNITAGHPDWHEDQTVRATR